MIGKPQRSILSSGFFPYFFPSIVEGVFLASFLESTENQAEVTYIGIHRNRRLAMTNIKRARLARGLSKQQASARADVHPVTFAKAERGEPVTEVVAFKISRALGLKLEDVETVETTNSEAQRTAV